MRYRTIGDVYAANDKIRERLLEVVGGLTEEQENLPTENGKWTLGAVVEHLAKVETGMTQICGMLLKKAEQGGLKSDGSVRFSRSFLEKVREAETENLKFEAPEIVRPEGGRPVSESLELLAESRRRLREMQSLFEAVDGTTGTYPHPAFGEMTAHDWLALIGGHEARHTAQIERILAAHDG